MVSATLNISETDSFMQLDPHLYWMVFLIITRYLISKMMNSRRINSMENYCAFSKNHKCINWTDYIATRYELEEANTLCHGNWIEIERKNEYIHRTTATAGIAGRTWHLISLWIIVCLSLKGLAFARPSSSSSWKPSRRTHSNYIVFIIKLSKTLIIQKNRTPSQRRPYKNT